MEDVLAVYKRPRDGDCLLVCLDEASKQLLADTRVPIPMKPGQPERRDYEYERNGTANLFMMFAPLEGWRHIEITDRRTAIDYARALEDLSDRHFPNAKKIVLVQDNLNTHKPASFTRLFQHIRQDGSSSGSNGITRQSTAVGSIWRRVARSSENPQKDPVMVRSPAELRRQDLWNGLPLLTPSDEHFASVVMPHLDDAYALARWLAGNGTDAEDIVQEACVRALRGLDRYAGGSARAWLLAITRNTTFTCLARNRPKALVMTEDIENLAPADAAVTPEEALIAKAGAAAIELAIAALTPPLLTSVAEVVRKSA